MPVPFQRANSPAPNPKSPSDLTLEGASLHGAAQSDKRSFATGEETIRLAVIKWFGPLVTTEPAARVGKNEHHESILETLLRLHAVSCSLVSADQRLPLPEQDVLAAIQTLNYIAATLHCAPKVIASRCAIRSLREQNLRANQLDPLQLRHLLTFHPEIRSIGPNHCNYDSLKAACEKTDYTTIHTWFATNARTKSSLPKDTPQLLRQMAVDLWHQGHHNFFETFVTELAVLDTRMFETAGWENTRQFFAIYKRVNGATCHFAASFLKPTDITLAIELYQQLGDSSQAAHFQELANTYNAAAFRHFEQAILAAAKDQDDSRNPFETTSASPFATRNPFDSAPPQGTPGIFTTERSPGSR